MPPIAFAGGSCEGNHIPLAEHATRSAGIPIERLQPSFTCQMRRSERTADSRGEHVISKVLVFAGLTLVAMAPVAHAQDRWDEHERWDYMHRLREACESGDEQACWPPEANAARAS